MNGKKPYLVVILIQSVYTGMFLLSKAAFDGGMNNFVFVFYRQAFATLFLLPISIFFEWKKRPSMSFLTFCKIFLLSLCGITLSLDVYGIGLVYTSATLAASTTNCLPVITFFLALLFRMETLKLKTKSGMAKLVGIVVCLGGATTIAFYQGPNFKIFCIHNIFGHHNSSHQQILHTSGPNSDKTWIKGCFLMLTSNTLWGLWLVLQGRVMKNYPSKLLLTTLQCLMSAIQSFVIAIALVRDPQEWKLGWNLRLLAVTYCGIVVTGFTFYLQAWVIEKKGPVFLAMSTPLNLIFTMSCSAFLLCQFTSFGGVLGGLLLVVGLYSVLWGKSKEEEKTNEEINICTRSIELLELEIKDCGQELKKVEDVTTKGPLQV